MEANEYWSLFVQTGAPEAYLLYRQAVRERESCGAATA